MGELITHRRLRGIVVQEYLPSIILMTYRDPTFDLAFIQTQILHLYLTNLSCSNEVTGMIAGRRLDMSTD